jgi:TRAP transporter 4TM/12TM fusion protein
VLFDRIRQSTVTVLGVALCLFTLFEVNYNQLQPQSALAIFVMVGLVICFLIYPLDPRWRHVRFLRVVDVVLALAVVVCFGYMVIQTEPRFQAFWSEGISLGNRAGIETSTDFAMGVLGLVLILEATRRSIGWILPILSLLFVAHSYYCYGSLRFDWPVMPDWMLPHSGQSFKDIVSTTVLQSLGVLGPAVNVMFTYVFLFVIFGAFLEMSGATQFIIDFAIRAFGRIRGGPAMVSVAASGLMGSLSGSAVANAVTTGTFTIPMMRSSRFPGYVAGGIEAAASSGGSLVPPVMGAGAYMMLELVQPEGGFVAIMKAAILPAILYYLSILAIVFFYSRRLGATGISDAARRTGDLALFGGAVFLSALSVLIVLLLIGFSAFKSVTGALAVILAASTFQRELKIQLSARWFALGAFLAILVVHQLAIPWTAGASPWLRPFLADSWIHPLDQEFAPLLAVKSLLSSAIVAMFGLLVFGMVHPAWRPSIMEAFAKAARNGVSLIAASACVGIVIGIVQQTGIASDFSAAIKSVVDTNLLLALVGIMVCSLILGMGVPSVVCYLLMATLMGSLLNELGVPPLAAHLFIFYFGMMSMVTPPVALAAYATASIADAPIMQTSFAAFRFSLVGFTLPFMFVYRPALCFLARAGETLTTFAVLHAFSAALFGILALAAGLAGYLRGPLSWGARTVLFGAAALLLAPITQIGPFRIGLTVDLLGAGIFLVIALVNIFAGEAGPKEPAAPTGIQGGPPHEVADQGRGEQAEHQDSETLRR